MGTATLTGPLHDLDEFKSWPHTSFFKTNFNSVWNRITLLQNNKLQSHRIELHGVILHFTLKVLICKSRLLDLDPWTDTSFLIFPFTRTDVRKSHSKQQRKVTTGIYFSLHSQQTNIKNSLNILI